jgi:hypothetical protein
VVCCIDIFSQSQAASFAQSNTQHTSEGLSSGIIATAPLAPAASPTTQATASSKSQSDATTLRNEKFLDPFLVVLLFIYLTG